MKSAPSHPIFISFFLALVIATACSPTAVAFASECSGASPSGVPPESTAAGHRQDGAFQPHGAYFVSPAGRDGWSGRIADPASDGSDGPFATVERALSARRDAGAKDAAIYLRAGRYAPREPIVLTARDEGLTLAAYPGEYPALTGSTVFHAAETLPGGRYRFAFASDPGQEIFADGHRLTLAFAPSPQNDQGWREAVMAGKSSTLMLAGLQPADVAGATIEVFDRARSRNGFTRPVQIAQDGAAVRLAPIYPEPMTDIGYYRLLGRPVWVSAKGLFGWDQKGGGIVVAPPDADGADPAVIQVPVLKSLIVLRGARDVRIDGLSFGETRMALARELESAAIVLEESRRITLVGNDFRNVGEAVRLIGSSDNILERNTVSEAAASAIELQDGSDRNVILENGIRGAGRIGWAAAAIYLHGASSNRLRGNRISDTGGHGIGIDNWDDGTVNLGNIVERNRLRSTSRETFDTGAIEMLGRSGRNTASIIRDNDISDAGPQPAPGDHLFPASGIYLDDLTSGVLVCDNHISGAPLAAIHVHGGSDITVTGNTALLDRPHAAFVFLEAADPRSGGDSFSFPWSPPPGSGAQARHRLEIRFDNDAAVGGEDRDLFVSRVEVAGRVYAADGGEAVYSLADGRTLPGQVSLPWNGALIWNVPIEAAENSTVPISVFAWGNPAAGVGAHFTVSVDGKPIGDASARRGDEMHGNTIARNKVLALAADVELLRTHSGGRPALADNVFVGPRGAEGPAAGPAAARRSGHPVPERD